MARARFFFVLSQEKREFPLWERPFFGGAVVQWWFVCDVSWFAMRPEPNQKNSTILALGIERTPSIIIAFAFERPRAPKCAKLGLGASAVHVRSRLCSRFFGVGPTKKAKKAARDFA